MSIKSRIAGRVVAVAAIASAAMLGGAAFAAHASTTASPGLHPAGATTTLSQDVPAAPAGAAPVTAAPPAVAVPAAAPADPNPPAVAAPPPAVAPAESAEPGEAPEAAEAPETESGGDGD
jgi:hypothetical protein